MRYVEFECAPSVTAIVDAMEGAEGRFVLEDVGGGTAIIGAWPLSVLTPWEDDSLETLRERLSRFGGECATVDAPFAGGAVGWLSYDLGRCIEKVPSIAEEDVPTPYYCLGFYDSALCIDLAKRRCVAVSWSGDREALDHWRGLALDAPETSYPVEYETVHFDGRPEDLQSNFTKAAYLRAVGKIKDYIAAGDVYQVNLAQRFEAEISGLPWYLYKVLRRINPAPNSSYVELGPVTLAGASPELFLSYDPVTRMVRTKPIKGTRPRGRTSDEDASLARELAASEKDRAENLMIVDMERNDLGRVAKYGSVRVPKLWDIEAHPNVFQMVSTVEAELAQSYGPVDLIRACFPGGSITGAPKIRSMEIIEELEPQRRGVYTGSAGFIDFRGNVDLSIVIRSFIVSGSRAYFHAGGGIVIDSDPELEYQETLDKAAGLMAALRREQGIGNRE